MINSKKTFLKKELNKIALHGAGVKSTMAEPMEVSKPSHNNMEYPTIYLNSKNAPELKGYEVKDDITMVIKGSIRSHSLNEYNKDSRETWDVEIKEIGIS
jgi:hypothetical protein